VNAPLTHAPLPADPMAAEMQAVDEVIRRRLTSEVALVDQIANYIVGAGGKRIRPRLVLLFSRMVEVGRMRVLDVLADATNVIAEGEVLQLMNMHDADLAVEDYLRVIRYKTAKLFEASARLGAVIADAPREIEDACANFGRSLGTAFQLIDDLLDYEGDPAALGKNVGDDLREGKPTLPLLFAMAHGTPEESALIRRAIEQGEVERLAEIVQIVRRTGAIDATRDAARREADHAREQLAALPDSEARTLLMELCVRSVERSS